MTACMNHLIIGGMDCELIAFFRPLLRLLLRTRRHGPSQLRVTQALRFNQLMLTAYFTADRLSPPAD